MARTISWPWWAALSGAACLCACSEPATPPEHKAQAAPVVAPKPLQIAPSSQAPALSGAPALVPVDTQALPLPLPAPLAVTAQAINQAGAPAAHGTAAKPAKAGAYDPSLVRTEVLLDRAGFSPGVIDGKPGENLRHAIAAYAQAHGLTPAADGGVDPTLWAALTSADAAPAMQAYRITADDVAGPFIGEPPKDYAQLAKLPALSYSGPDQLLAEKFHMDRALLKAMNPGADFGKAGTVILAAAPRPGPRGYEAARIEVDKSAEAVRVYDEGGKLAAFYPASVGSTERPAPSGTFQVQAVAPRPAYYYDPARLTFAPTGAKGKLKIAPGPNNPVGSTWIALTIPTYGIHGSPDPSLIGKRQSHGCVRLTNWDAAELGKAARKGVEVDFVGQEQAPASGRRALRG